MRSADDAVCPHWARCGEEGWQENGLFLEFDPTRWGMPNHGVTIRVNPSVVPAWRGFEVEDASAVRRWKLRRFADGGAPTAFASFVELVETLRPQLACIAEAYRAELWGGPRPVEAIGDASRAAQDVETVCASWEGIMPLEEKEEPEWWFTDRETGAPMVLAQAVARRFWVYVGENEAQDAMTAGEESHARKHAVADSMTEALARAKCATGEEALALVRDNFGVAMAARK